MDLPRQIKKHKCTKYLPHFLALFYFVAATIYITFPLIFHMTNMLFEKVDDAYISWILNWDIHSFTTNIFNIFNGNIYYPYHNTLAYSDNYLTSAANCILSRLK